MDHTNETTADLYKSLTDNFEYLNFLGKGAYGKVYQVRKIHGKDENTIYAMKCLLKRCIVSKGRKSFDQVVSEFKILKSIKHSFLVELMYVFQDTMKIYFVLEYLSGGTLDALVQKRILFSEPHASFYLKEIILAVEYLHSKNVIHRDLKPQNVLLDSAGHVKLTDFGLSKEKIHDGNLTRTVCGTPAYMAPEIRTRKGYDKAIDWWALGILCYILMVGFKPFIAGSLEELEIKISQGIFKIPERLSILAKDLIFRLLQVDPKERLGSDGAHEIKNHNFFGDTLWDEVLQRLETPPFIPNVHNTDIIETNNTSNKIFSDAEAMNNLFKEFYFINSGLKEKP